ncbi:MAG: NAD(P)-dependent oxidoreductase [Chloroflexota bacterium]
MQVCFLDALEERIRDYPGEYLSQHRLSFANGNPESVPVDTEALITWSGLLDARLIQKLPRLSFVQRIGYFRGADLRPALDAGAQVAVWPKGVSNRVAMHTTTFLLALSRQLLPSHRATIAGENEAGFEPAITDQRAAAMNWPMIRNVDSPANKTLGIIGFGEIGACFARQVRAFDMDILYFKRNRMAEAREAFFGVHYAPLDELLIRSDYVASFVPYSSESERMLGARELGLMKPSAYFMNTGRGNTVDEVALIDLLRNRGIRGAALDVYSIEPVPADHPVLTLENVLYTPHNAGGIGGWQDVFTRIGLNLEAMSAGRLPVSWEVPPAE